jgi:spermidine synthase/tetratricopeptide (TPR) repeat protein
MVVSGSGRGRLRVRVFATTGLAVLVLLNVLFTGEPVIKLSHFFKDQPGLFTLRYFREGPDASIAVLEKANGRRDLNINGHSTACTNYMDMQVHRMLSHLPVLLHKDPKKVLIIGFGMGSTAWGCCQYNQVERVDVVELLRDEKETAKWFEEVNHGVLDHPKLKFIQGDGRNYLLGTRERYDVISFNAIHPRYSANLYTVDFYRMCRAKITSDGIICAWMTQNSLVDVEWRMLCRSFTEVFPYSTLWYCNPQHFCLIGSAKPLKINFDDWRERTAQEGVSADLRDSNLDDPFVFVTRYMFGDDKLHRYLADSPLNTDDRPLVEFARESTREERDIINELIELKDDVVSMLEESPQSEEVRDRLNSYDRGSRWMMRGQTEAWYPTGPLESEIAHRRALLLCPENQDVRHNLYFSEQNEKEFQRALEERPNDPMALFHLGRIAMERGDFDRAEEYLLRSLAIREGMPEASFQLGLLRLFQGRLEESAAILGERLRRTPGTAPVVSFAYYEALIRLGVDVDQATRGKENIARQVPNVAEYLALTEKTALMMRERQSRVNQ